MRVRKDNGTNWTEYIYFGGNVIAERDQANAWTDYIFAGGKRIAKAPGVAATTGTEFYHSDHLGSARLMTNASGGVVANSEATMLPYGQQYETATGTNHYKFTGKERDAESNLDYFGARYYGSNMGRFTSPDAPFADQHATDPQSWNLYAYTLNNPLRYVDPDGLAVNEAALARAKQQIASQSAGSTYTLFFLGIHSGEGNYASTKTATELPKYSSDFGLGQLDIGEGGNTALLPNDNNAADATFGAANTDQVDTANAIYKEAQDAGLNVQMGTHSNGVNAGGKFASGLPTNALTNAVVIAPNTASTTTMTNIVNASQRTTIITSPRDNRLAMAPLAHRSPGFWSRVFRRNPKVTVVKTNQRCHGAQCYGQEMANGNGKVQ